MLTYSIHLQLPHHLQAMGSKTSGAKRYSYLDFLSLLFLLHGLASLLTHGKQSLLESIFILPDELLEPLDDLLAEWED